VCGAHTLFRPHPQPLSYAVGEGSRAFPLSRLAGEGDKGGEGNTAHMPVHACAGKNSPCCRDSVPNRRTLVSSCRFPPLREGNRVGRVGSVPPACRGNLKKGVIGHTRFCELWLRDWYTLVRPAGARVLKSQVLPTPTPAHTPSHRAPSRSTPPITDEPPHTTPPSSPSHDPTTPHTPHANAHRATPPPPPPDTTTDAHADDPHAHAPDPPSRHFHNAQAPTPPTPQSPCATPDLTQATPPPAHTPPRAQRPLPSATTPPSALTPRPTQSTRQPAPQSGQSRL
jgi:hypothetical protein